METHNTILDLIETYKEENQAWEEKGNKSAAPRARKALGEIGKLTKQRRAEIQEKKNAMNGDS